MTLGDNPHLMTYLTMAGLFILSATVVAIFEYKFAPIRSMFTTFGVGPWYARLLQAVGFLVAGSQAIKLTDALLPGLGTSPPVGIGTVIIAGLGASVALFGYELGRRAGPPEVEE